MRMHWREIYDGLHDVELLLYRTINSIHCMYEAARARQLSTILLSIEFEDIFVGISEIFQIYLESENKSDLFIYQLEYFLTGFRETIAIVCANSDLWIQAHYTFCKSLIYKVLFIIVLVNSEQKRLEKFYSR